VAGDAATKDVLHDGIAQVDHPSDVATQRVGGQRNALCRRAVAIEAEFGGALYTNQAHLWQPRRWALCHNYTLRVIVADPKWAAHLEPGLEWGTTAYDVWFERAAGA
jgi:hypothetical protein